MRRLPFAILIIIFAARSPAQEQISIKDLHLGLGRLDVYNLRHQACDAELFAKLGSPTCFTIGGAPMTDLKAIFGADTKMEAFLIEFSAQNYDAVKAALVSKYPALTCSADEVQNKMGAQFRGENCIYRTDLETLSLQKYGSKLTTGRLTLASNSWLRAQEKANNKKKDDI